MPVSKNKRNQIYRFARMTGAPSKRNGQRASKNSHPNDFDFRSGGKPTHTSPVKFLAPDDTGVRDPSRRRHMHTKAMHAFRRKQEAEA
jgi:hypothetical protein